MPEPEVAPTAEPAVVAPVAEPTALNVDPVTAPTHSKEDIFTMFKDSLGDDLKGHSYIDKYKNADDFAKAGINHQGAFTQKASDYLSSEDPVIVAERNKFFGVPGAADGYEVSQELSEVVTEESLAAFKDKAHEMNLPAKYMNELVQFQADMWEKNAENIEASKVAEKDAVTKELQEQWKGDTFDHNKKQVENLLLGELGLSAEDLTKTIGNSSKLITALFEKVVPLYGSDKLIEGTMTQTRASASERMSQINKEMFNASSGTPEYAALIVEKTSLMSKMST